MFFGRFELLVAITAMREPFDTLGLSLSRGALLLVSIRTLKIHVSWGRNWQPDHERKNE